jgi:molybdate transport system substrate-binding protein
MKRTFFVALQTVLLLIGSTHVLPCTTHAAEIRVMCSGGFADTLNQLIPAFERATGHTIVPVIMSMGVGPNYIPNRVRRGETVDVVILPDEAVNDLTKEGHIVSGSRTPLVKSRIGMAVRAGAPKPDISSVDTLKQTLLTAKSIAFSAPGEWAVSLDRTNSAFGYCRSGPWQNEAG